MSDELDSADAAAEDTGQTGAMTQPLRPTGKRPRQRTGGAALAEVDVEDEALTEQFEVVDAKDKKSKKAKADGADSRNPFVFVLNYLKQVVAELRKVIWPNRKQMVSYTSVVLAFLVFMVTLIGLVDLGWAKLVLWVFG